MSKVKEVVDKYSEGFPARRSWANPFARELLEAVREEVEKELNPPKGSFLYCGRRQTRSCRH